MAKFTLKPENELIIGGATIGIVYSIFSLNTPNLADVRADQPGNINTHKAVKQAVYTSAAVTAALGLLGKSPTVFILGGAMTVYEAWKYHFANWGACGANENQASQWQQMG
jgi:hypothetical protein